MRPVPGTDSLDSSPSARSKRLHAASARRSDLSCPGEIRRKKAGRLSTRTARARTPGCGAEVRSRRWQPGELPSQLGPQFLSQRRQIPQVGHLDQHRRIDEFSTSADPVSRTTTLQRQRRNAGCHPSPCERIGLRTEKGIGPGPAVWRASLWPACRSRWRRILVGSAARVAATASSNGRGQGAFRSLSHAFTVVGVGQSRVGSPWCARAMAAVLLAVSACASPSPDDWMVYQTRSDMPLDRSRSGAQHHPSRWPWRAGAVRSTDSSRNVLERSRSCPAGSAVDLKVQVPPSCLPDPQTRSW